MEKAEYDKHENDTNDAGYERFLNRLWSELRPRLPLEAASQKVLDFGCGPGPLLAKMMSEDGFDVKVYDHFYAPDQSVLQPSHYDVITSTEVIEHLHEPKQVFEQWLSWLKPQGYLGLMTKLVTKQSAFANWHYKNDLTHVCFFSEECFNWLARTYALELSIIGKDVIIFKKLA
ncbi:class I SAM-dependent methyltransferase [Oceaniserpentilla sp. 4NH20-0058]